MRQTTGTTKASGVPRPERRGLRPRTTLSALCEASVLQYVPVETAETP